MTATNMFSNFGGFRCSMTKEEDSYHNSSTNNKNKILKLIK